MVTIKMKKNLISCNFNLTTFPTVIKNLQVLSYTKQLYQMFVHLVVFFKQGIEGRVFQFFRQKIEPIAILDKKKFVVVLACQNLFEINFLSTCLVRIR